MTKLLGTYRDKIILERLQFPLRKRLWDLRDAGRAPPDPDVLRWAAQIALGLQHLHSRGVLQVDVGPHNVLLDRDDNAKLSDFARSSIDGSCRLVCPGRRAEHPDIPAGAPSVRSEIFALGSTLYELETTRQPYHDRDDHEVHRLFLAGDFPHTARLILGDVMRKCWASKYALSAMLSGIYRALSSPMLGLGACSTASMLEQEKGMLSNIRALVSC
ncbi:hypothetical protein PHISP_00514 [Aspergillus sp. HF37]|nr:hypothetical protein PHISP_00514 [Aspergillus sp. HF37]